MVRRPRHTPTSPTPLTFPAHWRAGPGAARGEERNKLLSVPWIGRGRWGREVLGPPQVAFAALSLGRLGPRNGGASPSLVSSKLLYIFHFWGGRGKFCISGRSGLETSPPRPGSTHLFSPHSPAATSRTEFFQVGEGGSRKGSWRSSDRRGGAGVASLGPGRRGLPFWVLPAAPRSKLWRKHSPRGRCSEKELCSGWPVPFECVFSFSFPLLLPPPPFSFKS